MTYELDENYSLNLLKPYWKISDFRATLGHKLNHSFDAKTYFSCAYHARFGYAVTVIAEHDILRGEEVFVNYHYEDDSNDSVPLWYAEMYKAQKGEVWKGDTW